MPTSLPGTPPHILALKSSPIVSNLSGRQPHCQQHKEILRHSLVFVVSPPFPSSLPLCRSPFCSPHAHFPITEMYVQSLSPSSLLAHVLYLVIFLHSSMPFIPPPYAPRRRCLCGIEVLLRFVVATNIRNAGRPYYSVTHLPNLPLSANTILPVRQVCLVSLGRWFG
ncbi:hypothetical protein HD554DRAFT_482234 [Boletus coccyginus]|nr:hypothetical protein HD554DRAFT_482234 [Boletus coccyginus]